MPTGSARFATGKEKRRALMPMPIGFYNNVFRKSSAPPNANFLFPRCEPASSRRLGETAAGFCLAHHSRGNPGRLLKEISLIWVIYSAESRIIKA
jgi:hypothetical protein